MFILYFVICCTCLVTVFHVHIIVAMTWIICCKIIMLTFNEHDLTVDQVPPNRAYPCNHICLYGRALIRSAGGCLLRVSPKREGYARQLPLAGQTEAALITSFVLGTRPHLGQVY